MVLCGRAHGRAEPSFVAVEQRNENHVFAAEKSSLYFLGSVSTRNESNSGGMRSFLVKHPILAAELVGVVSGLAGAVAGFTPTGIIFLGFAVGIGYAIWSDRLENAPRTARAVRNGTHATSLSHQDDTEKPIHPE